MGRDIFIWGMWWSICLAVATSSSLGLLKTRSMKSGADGSYGLDPSVNVQLAVTLQKSYAEKAFDWPNDRVKLSQLSLRHCRSGKQH